MELGSYYLSVVPAQTGVILNFKLLILANYCSPRTGGGGDPLLVVKKLMRLK